MAFVYLIVPKEGYYGWDTISGKIGFSKAPNTRLAALQTGHPKKLDIVGLLPDSSISDETRVHRQFKSQRLEGEWFSLSLNLIAEFDLREDFRNYCVKGFFLKGVPLDELRPLVEAETWSDGTYELDDARFTSNSVNRTIEMTKART